MASLYETDFYDWSRAQASVLRRMARERVNTELDLENVAEEIESMGVSERREVHSRLARIIEHLLKLEGSTLWEPRRQWQNSVAAERESLQERFERSPSLYAARNEELSSAYAKAARRVDRNHLELCMDKPPRVCPFDLDDQILNADWFPLPRDG